MITEEAIRGSAIWAAYGDALGFMTEMRSRGTSGQSLLQRRTGSAGQVAHLMPWTRRIGGEFGVTVHLPVGCYSDDTQLRLCTCRSIRGDGKFDVEAFSKVEVPVWGAYALGGGRGTKTAAESLKKRHVQWNFNFFDSRYSRYMDSGGNGAAMRIQPHVWSAPADKPLYRIMNDVVRNTVSTHGHMRAIVGALFHALCVRHAVLNRVAPVHSDWAAMIDVIAKASELMKADSDLAMHWIPMWEKERGNTVENVLNETVEEVRNDIASIQRRLELPRRDADQIGELEDYTELLRDIGCLNESTIGSATKTALAAAFLGATCNSPYQAVVLAANALGSDTDTIATMTGAILGCLPQVDPPEDVMDKYYIELEAKRMFGLSQGRTMASHSYPDLLLWQPPQNQVDTVGTHDGKWSVRGLGSAIPMGEAMTGRASGAPVWQWFRLDFGQSMLLRRRTRVSTVSKASLPVDPSPTEKSQRIPPEQIPLTRPTEIRPSFPDGDSSDGRSAPLTVEVAVEICKRSKFRGDIVGEMLNKLAIQDGGIEKSIGFAAIVSRYVRNLHSLK